jgi:hypothetical protein
MNKGMSFTSVLTLIFIVLKLTNAINWDWFWVLSPIWISAGIVVIIGIFIIILMR